MSHQQPTGSSPTATPASTHASPSHPQSQSHSQPHSQSWQPPQDNSYYPHPPVLHDHLRPTPGQHTANPSLILPSESQLKPVHVSLPPSHPDFATQQLPDQSTASQLDPSTRAPRQPSSTHAAHHTMPVNDPSKTTIAFDMYIPTQQNPHYQQNHPAGCDCCPHHHKRKNGAKILYRHLKQPTWTQYIKDKAYLAWEFIKHTYWHVEPWVVRPLIAGIAYNIGIQLARVCIQSFFPTFFPTTVYLPLRANARFYDLHAKRVQIPAEDMPLQIPPLLMPETQVGIETGTDTGAGAGAGAGTGI